MNNGAVTHHHCLTVEISAPLCDVTGIIATMAVVINRLSILSCSQSPSPVPGKRSKFDKLQSSPAEKEQKPEWLQSLSKSAHKVGTFCVFVDRVQTDWLQSCSSTSNKEGTLSVLLELLSI